MWSCLCDQTLPGQNNILSLRGLGRIAAFIAALEALRHPNPVFHRNRDSDDFFQWFIAAITYLTNQVISLYGTFIKSRVVRSKLSNSEVWTLSLRPPKKWILHQVGHDVLNIVGIVPPLHHPFQLFGFNPASVSALRSYN